MRGLFHYVWQEWVALLTSIPATGMSLAAALATAGLLWWAWCRQPMDAAAATL